MLELLPSGRFAQRLRWRAGFGFMVLWLLALHAHAAEPLVRHGVVLLQPDSVLYERVNDSDDVAECIRAVEAAAREAAAAAASPQPAAGFIVVAVRPGRRLRVWLDFDSPPSFDIGHSILAKTGAVPAFEVRNGPVVFALKVALWGGFESRRAAPAPFDWKAAAQRAGRKLELDELLDAVWP